MKVIIDRFEGAMAIAEISEGKTGNLPRILIPDAKEGDCIEIIAGAPSRFFAADKDNDLIYILTPKGKYAMSKNLGKDIRIGSPVFIKVSAKATEKRKKKIKSLTDDLFS